MSPVFTSAIFGPDGMPDRDDAQIFPYWSFTKTALAITALSLAEDGVLDIDTPVLDVTLRQLLTHTAGMPDYFTLPAYRQAVAHDEDPWPRERLIRDTLAQGRLFAPGAGWSYSNLGYLLAREAIETASGQSFATLFSTRIAKRLGLHTARLAETRDQFAAVHWPQAHHYHPGWVYHGCLIGTAADAARLLHGLFTGKLLSPSSLTQMMVTHPLGGALPGRPWTACGYAMGLMSGRMGAAGRGIGHSGGGPFSVNAVYHFPDLDTPATVASFTTGPHEGIAEHACVNAAIAP
ncbi:serine hydrolase domain-containing protein [Pararhodobacter zhoushanensis]|uniref:serine hydrolase domain-containing protein n=1 Tax=Pararhodobacter zhoushanensis TaxID=2479545 RepID=UPI000F8CDD53|nr:serine hydrolase domain-containing protein [Pararhodobacter zhoushanensis]